MSIRIRAVYAALVGILATGLPLSAQCTFNQLCPSISLSGQFDYVVASNFDGAAAGGSLVVSGIPAGATILGSRFICEASIGTTVTGATFNGAAISPVQVGFGIGTTPGAHARSYSANVTVPGNGTYSYTVSGGVNTGVGLVVIYRDCNLTSTYRITLHQGYNPGFRVDLSDGDWTANSACTCPAVQFGGFTVDGTAAPEARLSFLVMGGSPGLNEEYFFEGASLDCCDPAATPVEFEDYDVSSFFSGGETSATLEIAENGDTFSIPMAVFRTRTSAPGTAACAVNYCTAGTSASGCQAILSSSGTASATATSGFDLTASGVEGQKDGLFFFSTNGRQANPWGNGTSFQCVVPPVFRGGLLLGSGTPGLCDGAITQDLNALWCAACPKPLKNPGAGALVQSQFWYRDPQNTSNQTTSFSDAHEFTVVP